MSTATQSTGKPEGTFTERIAQVDGSRIRYREAGQGHPVVVLCGGNNLVASPLATLLARHFRVLVVEMPGSDHTSPRARARTLTQTVAALGLDHYVLVGTAAQVPSALWHAAETPEHAEGLVLISPPALSTEGQTTTSGFTDEAELASRLTDIQTPTLLLLGTNDKTVPPDTGQRYVERLANCYYVLVYDAGRDIETDRPEALFATVRDFIERRGAFIVEQASTALNP
jgi:pimeloyl-ACP methyl ester carboxylesterase